jgi:thiamine-phosphate pyrophosphorylase
MKLDPSKSILYLITRGETTEVTTADSLEFKEIIEQVSAAVSAGIDFVQLREKRLSARTLFELTLQAGAVVQGSTTRVLVNDRADIAAGAGAAGVHLTTRSIDSKTIRRTCGDDFVIGISTHSLEEAHLAKEGAADFIVFGPVFATSSKPEYTPVGLAELSNVTRELDDFPVLALGGVTRQNLADCLRAGAQGVAGISLFREPQTLMSIITQVKQGVA